MPTHLLHFDPNTKTVASAELPLDTPNSRCTVWLRPVAGAQSIQVVVTEGVPGVPALRLELDASSEDPVALTLMRSSEGELRGVLPSPVRPRMFRLPLQSTYAPPHPILFRETGKLDVVFLLDGTARMLKARGNANGGAWGKLLGQLTGLVAELHGAYSDIRAAVLAFGDHSLGDLARAPDLDCQYLIYPDDSARSRLRPLADEDLTAQLEAIRYTSGGDFTDALADGLRHAQKCGWRVDARKLLVLCGDSPGASVLEPGPAGVDAQARSLDVDSEAADLQETCGVEIVSVYLGEAFAAEAIRPLFEHTRRQYERLASHATVCFSAAAFDPKAGCTAIRKLALEPGLARGSSFGLLDSVEG